LFQNKNGEIVGAEECETHRKNYQLSIYNYQSIFNSLILKLRK
jgi:hypothetical protein